MSEVSKVASRLLAARMAAAAAAAVAIWVLAAIGCATFRQGAARGHDAEALRAVTGWDLLAEGRVSEAERVFGARAAVAPADPVALFGRATLADQHGDPASAIDDYASALLALAAASPSAGEADWAAVAAARSLELYDEIGSKARARIARRLRPVELAQAPGLPWLARVELARLGEHVARQSNDAEELARGAAADGCAERVFEVGSLGPLPYLDLDRPAGEPFGTGIHEPAAADWRPVIASGCHLEVPAGPDGRGGARLLRGAVEVAAGRYDLVVDFAGEARLTVDGGPARAHGSATGYGPRVSVTRLVLGAGRHELTVRLAAKAGEAQLGLLLLPASNGARARFVDPREGAAAASAARLAEPSERPSAPGIGTSSGALADYCAVAIADLTGAPDELATAVARLEARQRFAIGLALVGEVARHDQTRPASFARDAARRALRVATAVDPALARVWQTLALLELEDERPRDAIDDARRAREAAPGWWAPALTLARALSARGLEDDARRALGAAAGETAADVPCPVLEALRAEADERRELARQEQLEAALTACGGDLDARIDRLRGRGETGTAISLLRTAVRLDPGREDLSADLALALAAAGRRGEALGELGSLVARDPQDPMRRVRLADAQAAAGQAVAARKTIEEGVYARPDVPEIRRAARALGVALPLDGFRVDGRAAIRAFEAAGGHYAAPAVIVLDRGVTRIFPSGATMELTHEIVRVDSKDAIDRWGEIEVPNGAEILTVRTHKPDGTTREPEEITGKDTISAPDLEIGDYVEWELLETHSPSEAFAPGFLGQRFYFQSFEAPIARSELTLVAPAASDLEIDRRAGAPPPQTRLAADGTRVTRFAASAVPQLYAERSAVPAIEYVPSVRASSGVGWSKWASYVADELRDAVRISPDVRAVARKLAAANAPGDAARLAAAVVEWVTENVEATDDLIEPAAYTVVRGRGSRVALTLALAGELGIPARAVLVRSRLVAEAADPAPPQELEDFGDTLVELEVGKGRMVYADLRLRHAAFGYVPPGLDGARTVSVPTGAFGIARSTALEDRRTIDMTIRLDERGGGVAVATEELAGWPALEWAELVDRFGADRVRLRQDFEQRSLGVQFPGARLRDLEVELPHDAGGRAGTARVRYSFVSSHLAMPVDRGAPGGEMRLEPTFFRSQPGRRFAAEPQRSTGLMLGFDVPVRMTATVELPGAARLDDSGLASDLVVARRGGYRFVEGRNVEPGRPNVIVLHRESVLPIMRVSPGDYAAVAADLRRVDGAEQAEIRIRLGGAAHGVGAPR